MTAAELRCWLSEDEGKLYKAAKEWIRNSKKNPIMTTLKGAENADRVIQVLESLVECRRVMEKHEWQTREVCHPCLECGKFKRDGHAPDCVWAKCIAGYPREVKDEKV